MAYYGSRNVIVEKCKNTFCFDLDCGFVHTYQYCFLFQNTECGNNVCPFLHCTSMEQLRYETTGIATENLKSEIGRTLQNQNICRDFKNNACNRTNCEQRHIMEDIKPLECRICKKSITKEKFGTGECGHIFCYDCALDKLQSGVHSDIKKVYCVICNRITTYIKLM